MKKCLLMILAVLLSVSVISCSKKEENNADEESNVQTQEETGAIAEQRKKIKEKDCLVGIAYLGERDSATEELGVFLNRQAYWEEYPMFMEISPNNIIEESGSELFLILPLKDVTTKVYRCEYNSLDGTYVKGEEINVSSNGEPFYLQGNMFEPSLVVVVEGNGEKSEFLLVADTEKGQLLVNDELVYDLFS